METVSNKTFFRLAIGLAIVATLMLIWLSLGVGIIGQDGDPANLMYFAVVVVGIVGAIVTRLRPVGMKFVLQIMAMMQGIIALIALVAGLGLPWSPPLEILGLTLFFIAMFAVSAWLFHRAAGK
jgi:hypothetical protein